MSGQHQTACVLLFLITFYRQHATYMAVSEASEVSDDMYAAIDDPTYIPAGGISQTNSDTYAVINLPDYDSGSQTYQKLEGAEEVFRSFIVKPIFVYSDVSSDQCDQIGRFLHFGQPFKALEHNRFAQISYILRQFLYWCQNHSFF